MIEPNELLAVIVLAALLTAAAVFGGIDAKNAEAERAKYCQMVDTWESQAHLPPNQRDGWPPYDGTCDAN